MLIQQLLLVLCDHHMIIAAIVTFRLTVFIDVIILQWHDFDVFQIMNVIFSVLLYWRDK